MPEFLYVSKNWEFFTCLLGITWIWIADGIWSSTSSFCFSFLFNSAATFCAFSNNSSGRHAYAKTIFIDGGIYIANTSEFLSTNEMIGNNPEIMMILQSHAIDVDTFFDLKIARAIYDSKEF